MTERVKNILANRKVLIPAVVVALVVILSVLIVAGRTNKPAQAAASRPLDVDRELFSAELSLTQTRRNELLSLVRLYKALGGGWQQ